VLPAWTVVLASLAYLGILFAIAYWADRRADRGRSVIASATVYSLSLAVYCTTWTFYGSVGRAAATGIGFLPIYLGPTLMLALGWQVLRKLVRVAKANRITSIADFVASRYGKSQVLGGLVTVIAVVGIVPYIALQLKAVSHTYTLLVAAGPPMLQAQTVAAPPLHDSAFYVAIVLAAFSILFGTRHLDATERHEGMVAAIAFESVVKLLAFLGAGVFVSYVLYDGLGDIFSRAAAVPDLANILVARDTASSYGSWASLTFLSMLSVLLLPRQFQIAVVENVNETHVRRAVWLFPLYLLLINIFVLPIALAGLMQFPAGSDADTFVLTLPLMHGQHGLALLVFVGGLSAATGMVIVETIALSTMICNDLVMPILLRWRRLGLERKPDLSGLLLNIRRGAIGGILLLGYVYFRVAGEAYALVAIGLISFAAVAQFAPAVFGGLYWRGGTRQGALAGLSAGFAVWMYTLLLPSFAKSGWLPPDFAAGAFGIDLLRPQQLFGLAGLDEISHSLFWSLLANVGCYVGVSLLRAPDMREAGQAALFVDGGRSAGSVAVRWRSGAPVTELLPLAGRFLGPERAREIFARHAAARGLERLEELPADADLAHFAESQLAGAIGSASARVMVASVVQEAPPDIDAVMDILDEASQVRAHSRELEEKSRQIERASAELRAANERLRELDRMKDDFISTVSHELRTPLTSIRAFSEMLYADPRIDLPERSHFLGIIVNEAERLTRLINQTLDLAKLESGRADWTSAVVDLGEVVRASADSLGQVYRDKGVALTLDVPEYGPEVLADRDRLVQVMINLMSNAQKFVVTGSGRVSVVVTATADGVRVSVADNGPGIAVDDRETIFEKFRQGGSVLTGKPRGTGLGLPISRQIIEYFGGRLWVEAAPGGGATFVFTLPRHVAG
jgi:Na+/proline symporter/nitrogen-specific signal transduction histidine kinase